MEAFSIEREAADKSLYVTYGEACYLLTKDQCAEIQTLKTTQEEADTRVLLPAWHAAEDGYRSSQLITQTF